MANEETENALSHLPANVSRNDRDIADLKQPPASIDPLGAAIDAALLQITKALVERQQVSNTYLRLLSRSNHRDK